MQVEALTLCEKLERSRDTLPGGLAMYHPEWHQGVVGILASRIKERFIVRLSPLRQQVMVR